MPNMVGTIIVSTCHFAELYWVDIRDDEWASKFWIKHKKYLT